MDDTTHDALTETGLIAYRASGLGVYGAVVRYAGMPLERIALIVNSSQVSGANPLAQANKIVFKDGALAPFKLVGRASMIAWFLQYSVMGCVFQLCDNALSTVLGTKTVPYGDELMQTYVPSTEPISPVDAAKQLTKLTLAPVLSGAIESGVSNRAEVQRFFGADKLTAIEARLGWGPFARTCGPAFVANSARNTIMVATSFVVTPLLYHRYYPQEQKNNSSLFWFGLGVNIFFGNVFGLTQQALWGRALDYAAVGGGRPIDYSAVVRDGLKNEGAAAFFTPTKWASRVLMNAPVQGTLPWFYNNVLPVGEPTFLSCFNIVRSMLPASLRK